MELLHLFWILKFQFQVGLPLTMNKSPSLRLFKSFVFFRLPLPMQILQPLLVHLVKQLDWTWRMCMSGCCVPHLPNPDPYFLWCSMSGCYLPLLPNPDLYFFLLLFGLIRNFLHASWIVWYLLFYFKSSNKFLQDSSFYNHQSYQYFINQSSLPHYLLDVFCSNWDFCSNHILCNILTPIRVHPHSYLQLPTWFSSQAHLLFILSRNVLLAPMMTPFLSTNLVLWLAPSVQIWPLWLCQIQHSCPWYLKGQWKNWNCNHFLKVFWHQRMICFSSPSGLSSSIIKGLPFWSSVLKSFFRTVEERTSPLEIKLRFT